MSAEYRLTERVVLESGMEPDYVPAQLVKYEILNPETVRVYVASERGESLRMEYSATVSVSDLEAMILAGEQIISHVRRYARTIAVIGGRTN